jgi:hypothetical protein
MVFAAAALLMASYAEQSQYREKVQCVGVLTVYTRLLKAGKAPETEKYAVARDSIGGRAISDGKKIGASIDEVVSELELAEAALMKPRPRVSSLERRAQKCLNKFS